MSDGLDLAEWCARMSFAAGGLARECMDVAEVLAHEGDSAEPGAAAEVRAWQSWLTELERAAAALGWKRRPEDGEAGGETLTADAAEQPPLTDEQRAEE